MKTDCSDYFDDTGIETDSDNDEPVSTDEESESKFKMSLTKIPTIPNLWSMVDRFQVHHEREQYYSN